MSCTKFMVGIAMHFLGIFAVCKFGFVNLVFFYHEISYFSVTTEWQHWSLAVARTSRSFLWFST